MSTTISVNKQTVSQFLSTATESSFLIPEYQRRYSWTEDEAETLFNDIWEFTLKEGIDTGNTYFLGSIIFYKNNGKQEIIDGQQRITSIFLLLRAIYTKLEGMSSEAKEAKNFMNQISNIIWKTDKLTAEVDKNSVLLESKVIIESENKILTNILKDGNSDKKDKDNYSINYRHYLKLFENISKDEPFNIYGFIYALLHQVVLLPIEAESQDTALTIFSTLNYRGLPLSDADIFKAKIYNSISDSKKEKERFIETWKEIEEDCLKVSEEILNLFTYNMFYVKAINKNDDSTRIALRKFYLQKEHENLLELDMLDDFKKILNIFKVIKKGEIIEDEAWSADTEILKALDILSSYSNEFWKYPTIIYYLTYRKKSNFTTNFLIFLRKLCVDLLKKFIEKPARDAISVGVLKLDVDIRKSDRPNFNFKIALSDDELFEKIKTPHKKIEVMLLKILAYNSQNDLLPEKIEIEHILPKKWQEEYTLEEDEEIVLEKIEHLGNKLPIEKKLNIKASNDYFSKKKEKYKDSKIQIVKNMGNANYKKWSIKKIDSRDKELATQIIEILNEWDSNYKNPSK